MDDLKTVDPLHNNIKDDEVKGLGLGHLYGVQPVGCFHNGHALAFQHAGNHPPHQLFIIHD